MCGRPLLFCPRAGSCLRTSQVQKTPQLDSPLPPHRHRRLSAGAGAQAAGAQAAGARATGAQAAGRARTQAPEPRAHRGPEPGACSAPTAVGCWEPGPRQAWRRPRERAWRPRSACAPGPGPVCGHLAPAGTRTSPRTGPPAPGESAPLREKSLLATLPRGFTKGAVSRFLFKPVISQ